MHSFSLFFFPFFFVVIARPRIGLPISSPRSFPHLFLPPFVPKRFLVLFSRRAKRSSLDARYVTCATCKRVIFAFTRTRQHSSRSCSLSTPSPSMAPLLVLPFLGFLRSIESPIERRFEYEVALSSNNRSPPAFETFLVHIPPFSLFRSISLSFPLFSFAPSASLF